jgi:hypothetical protein
LGCGKIGSLEELTCGFNPDAWIAGYGTKLPNQEVRFCAALASKADVSLINQADL